MSIIQYVDDNALTCQTRANWRRYYFPSNIRPTGGELDVVFWNALNRRGYNKVLDDGSVVELLINSGVEDLSPEEFRSLRKPVFNCPNLPQTEAAIRDVGVLWVDNMRNLLGGGAGSDVGFTLRSAAHDLLHCGFCIWGDDVLDSVFDDTIWDDVRVRVAFRGDRRRAFTAVSQILASLRTNFSLQGAAGDLDLLLRHMPEPMAKQWKAMLDYDEYVGGEPFVGLDRFMLMGPWLDGLGAGTIEKWYHTVHHTGRLGLDLGFAWGVFESGILEAHGIAIGSGM